MQRLPIHRVRVRYEGRVQGVGFRANVYDIATGLPVTGQVRNLRDGSVELVAEGEKTVLDQFCDLIRQRMDRNIIDENAAWTKIQQPQYQTFNIAQSE